MMGGPSSVQGALWPAITVVGLSAAMASADLIHGQCRFARTVHLDIVTFQFDSVFTQRFDRDRVRNLTRKSVTKEVVHGACKRRTSHLFDNFGRCDEPRARKLLYHRSNAEQ